ncbi:hypothetical protein N431DRAFT_463651 [Stipitochalara longipes BDJ]|nr:hypothetical protein N431DRAFT_463651 [Stipitochalara longipes BDJ]
MAQDQYPSKEEINEFLDDLDKNQNRFIEYGEVEHKLDEVDKEIAPHSKPTISTMGKKISGVLVCEGPEVLFILLVISMQIAFGTWQLVKYLTETQYRHAFGWGIVVVKTSAGTLYVVA